MAREAQASAHSSSNVTAALVPPIDWKYYVEKDRDQPKKRCLETHIDLLEPSYTHVLDGEVSTIHDVVY